MNKSNGETVILLHGIALSRHSLYPLMWYLRKQGYKAEAISYPSVKMNLNDLASWLHTHHLHDNFWRSSEKVHFIGHSMGGLLARRYISNYKDQLDGKKFGRMIMLGSPNSGSGVADALRKFPPYRWMFGPAGLELATDEQLKFLSAPPVETAIIAGTGGWLYPISGIFLEKPHDGRVTVESAKLPDMKDFLLTPASHTMMVYRPGLWRQISNFLKNGVFNHGH